MSFEDTESERRSLHKAVQDVIREEYDEAVVTGCVITFTLVSSNGEKSLHHTSFDIEGDRLTLWTAEGLLRDHLRSVDMALREQDEE